MKKALVSFLCVIMALCFAVLPAAAVNVDYEGELDPRTEEPVNAMSEEDIKRASVGSGALYDSETRCYIYSVNGLEVSMNVPSGIITTSAVAVVLPKTLKAVLYRNGVVCEKPDYSNINTVGKYVLVFDTDKAQTLEFTIVGDVTGIISGYTMPDGFYVTSASFNGETINAIYNYIDMTKEGAYDIRYRSADNDVSYSLAVTIDHTPPELKLEAVKDGYAEGPVDISDLEDGCAISIIHNDKAINYQQTLSKSGKYEINLEDKAGNTNSYKFRIRVYFNFNSVVFFIIVIAVIAALGVYILVSRRKLRTR